MGRKNKITEDRRPSFYSVNYEAKKTNIPKEKKGHVSFGIAVYSSRGETLLERKITAPLVSCWLDEEQMVASKAFFLLPINSPDLRLSQDCKTILEILLRKGPTDFSKISGLPFDVTCETNGLCRVGLRHGHVYTTYERLSMEQYKIVDSKAAAVESLINDMSSYITVGGTTLIDFSKVDEDLLIEIGFEKIKDVVGFGQPMWKYKPSQILRQGLG